MRTTIGTAGWVPQVAASATSARAGTTTCHLSASRLRSARFYEPRRWVSKKATVRRPASRAVASW